MFCEKCGKEKEITSSGTYIGCSCMHYMKENLLSSDDVVFKEVIEPFGESIAILAYKNIADNLQKQNIALNNENELLHKNLNELADKYNNLKKENNELKSKIQKLQITPPYHTIESLEKLDRYINEEINRIIKGD